MDIDIQIDTSDLERTWQLNVQLLLGDMEPAIQHACEEGAREATNTRIYQDRTAQLTGSIHGDGPITRTVDGVEGSINAGEEYATYVNEWESGQIGDGFMDRGANKADEVLRREIWFAFQQFERRMNAT